MEVRRPSLQPAGAPDGDFTLILANAARAIGV
jgi:hypothetical protein